MKASFNLPEIRLADGHRGFLVSMSARNGDTSGVVSAIVLVPGRPQKPLELNLPLFRGDVVLAVQNAVNFQETGPAIDTRFGVGLVKPDGTPV